MNTINQLTEEIKTALNLGKLAIEELQIKMANFFFLPDWKHKSNNVWHSGDMGKRLCDIANVTVRIEISFWKSNFKLYIKILFLLVWYDNFASRNLQLRNKGTSA